MKYQGFLVVLSLVFLSLINLSCKKKGNLLPDPKAIVYTLSLERQRDDNADGAFLSMSATTDGNHFYVSGGMNDSDLFIYTPKTAQWVQVPLSWKRSYTSSIYFKGKVFVAGGNTNIADQYRIDIYDEVTKTSNFVLFGDYQYHHPTFSAIVDNRYVVFYDYNYLYAYDSITDRWQTIDNPIRTRVTTTGMVVIGNKLYFNDIHYPDSIRIYDFKNNAWSTISSFQHQSHTKLLALDEHIYFYGNTSFITLDYIDVLDVKTGLWSKIMLPSGRTMYEMSIDPKSRSLVITGGSVSDVDVNGYTYLKTSNDLLIYHIDNKDWQQAKLKFTRYAHTTHFVGDYFIVHGGSASNSSYPLIKLPTEVYLVKYKKATN
ncbi:kelch repeat-containing protein [Pedobacter sp. Hv1]|uniref:Kelch repeat-containing protein n=1 Tax=Pedobacter sp. Hv1 TaxID=1740090 RepID=UPI0006D88EEC|nr:kelch repeat-containing protein [Pedobacter sp. Hv1]KQC02007.1 hypothetical protein AQF98_00070 [Pedobacter sp. Hv1]